MSSARLRRPLSATEPEAVHDESTGFCSELHRGGGSNARPFSRTGRERPVDPDRPGGGLLPEARGADNHQCRGDLHVPHGLAHAAQVQAAVAFAAHHSVRLRDLQNAAGAYIAQRLKCEAALVSSGAASALSLGTAGCMTMGNPDERKTFRRGPARSRTRS